MYLATDILTKGFNFWIYYFKKIIFSPKISFNENLKKALKTT
jgi:hypothetical protein